MQVYVMTNRWQFKPMQRMDLGNSSQQGISLTSQKAKAGDTNGTAVTASGGLCLSICMHIQKQLFLDSLACLSWSCCMDTQQHVYVRLVSISCSTGMHLHVAYILW